MKKRQPFNSTLKVKRISSSPYFKESFAQLEKLTIENKADASVLPFNSPERADILITNTHTVTSKITNNDLENCALLIHPNSGYDNLSAEFVAAASFPIIVGNPIRAQAVCNFILSALFSHYTKLPAQNKWDDKRTWNRKCISDLSILILGHGHIGSLLEKSLLPLAKSVQVYDPYAGLNEMNLENVDVIIPACSLNSKNKGLINRDFLLKCHPDFLLINAARGQLVAIEDLKSVLKSQPQAFAFLDVFEYEPCDFSQFSGIRNIQLSSHIAGVFSGIDEVTAMYEATVIADFQAMDETQFYDKYKNVLLSSRLKNGMLV
jgi:D-3-phosphoglycerate dehydrogenase